MKKIFAAAALQALLALFAAGAFCEKWTEYEESLFNQALQIRLESRKIDGLKAALDWIEKKREEFFSSIKEGSVGQEALLACENNFVLEQYHFLWEIDDKAKETGDCVLEQYNKTTAWNAAHPEKERNPLYSLSAYELANAAMPLMKYSQKISVGLEEKKFYDTMIKNGLQSGCLHLNAGLWYAFAPAFGGGSDSKAAEYFKKAAQIGPTDYEKFFGFVYLSQIDWKKGDSAAWQKDLQAADALLPQNVYTNFVRRVNKAGADVFEYADDKDKVLKKLEKFYGKK
ncbi:MAG: hypothetical protein J6V90_10030 [Treponema sp.]|nr:hypothetical protein [Treponema sp.]